MARRRPYVSGFCQSGHHELCRGTFPNGLMIAVQATYCSCGECGHES